MEYILKKVNDPKLIAQNVPVSERNIVEIPRQCRIENQTVPKKITVLKQRINRFLFPQLPEHNNELC